LNVGYLCLREPRDRIAHLLELETGAPPGAIQPVDASLMDLFMEVGQTFKAVDDVLDKKAQEDSPLLRARILQQGLGLTDGLTALASLLNAELEILSEDLIQLDDAWPCASAPSEQGRAAALPIDRLEDIFQRLSYLRRWQAQVQERLINLAT